MSTSRPEDRRTSRRFSLTRALFRYDGRTQSTVAGWLEQLPDLKRLS